MRRLAKKAIQKSTTGKQYKAKGDNMQNEIDKIEFVLENCEVITIDGKYIGELSIDNVDYSINRMACNYIDETYTANHFSISIHRNANIEEDADFTVGSFPSKRKPLNRLHEHNDITGVDIYFAKSKGLKGFLEKQKVKHFYLDWYFDEDDGSTDWTNKNQKTHMNQFGDLFITVDRNKGIGDIFNLEQIEDEQYMSFVWKMYGIDKV